MSSGIGGRARDRQTTAELIATAAMIRGLRPQVLVPSLRPDRQGIRVFDASCGGLGGSRFERIGVETGIDLAALVPVERDSAALAGECAPDAWLGARTRSAP
jgi:hypothetical protein